jgi:hypothetical protein
VFKRLFWLLMGVAVTLWAQHRFRRQIERYAPERVVRQVSSSVRSLGGDVRSAAQEGWTAMRQREESLRAQFRPTPG